MPVNFSTIRPMEQSTISRMPAYTANPVTPAASSPIGSEPKKKNSHWFLKTLAAVAVIAGGAALLRGKVDVFKNFDVKAALPSTATFVDKAKHYAMKAVAVTGDFLISKGTAVCNWVKGLIPKKP